MTPPFAGGAMSGAAPPIAAAGRPAAAPTLPAGHPPIAAQVRRPSQSPLHLRHASRLANRSRPRACGKPRFASREGGKEALLTVIDFPADAGPMMADPLANVNRWRGEVGLPELADAELKSTMKPIEIDGLDAQFVDAMPDTADAQQSQTERGTLAAMLTPRRHDLVLQAHRRPRPRGRRAR